MSVLDVTEALKQSAEEALEEICREEPGLSISYHLDSVKDLTYCEGGEDEYPHFIERRLWSLHLYFCLPGGKHAAMEGSVPYLCCVDGDPEPITRLCVDMWEACRFSFLMVTSGLERDLETIAKEAEG